MHKWILEIGLKNSGRIVKCKYDGPEDNPHDVIMRLFNGKDPNYWVDLYNAKNNALTFITVGEIASVDIYERKVKK